MVNNPSCHFSCTKYWEKSELGCTLEWISTVTLSLTELGMFNGNGFTPNYIKEAVKSITNDTFIQEWHNNKNHHNYCGICNVIKNEWKFEQYLTDFNFSRRVAMYKFRCRSNYLPISPPRFIDDIFVDVDCFCPFCHGQIGDEIHYLFFVRFWWRNENFIGYFPVYLNYPEIYHVQKLLNPKNSNDLKKISHFIHIIMKIFEHRNDWVISFDW